MDADSAFSQLVEAMAAELCEHYLDDDAATSCGACSLNTRAALTAALALDLTELCETCGGKREVTGPVVAQGQTVGMMTGPCPDCEDSGRVPSSVRLLIGEQVGVVATEPMMSGERKTFTGHVRAPQKDSEYRVYRVITLGAADATSGTIDKEGR